MNQLTDYRAPEAFDVIESNITPNQRKNLGELAKTLHQISLGKKIIGSEPYQLHLNNFICESSNKFKSFLNEVRTVPFADEYFEMNEFADSSYYKKPRIFMSPAEIYQVHRNLEVYIDDLVLLYHINNLKAPKKDDPLQIILSELGAAPEPGFDGNKNDGDIILDLKNRFTTLDGIFDYL